MKNKLWNLVGKQDYIINVQSPSNKSPVMGSFCETEYEIWTNLCRLDSLVHRRQKYGGSSPNSLRPISYFGSIWELYVLDLETNIFCKKKIQLHFSMNKGLTVPK